MKIKLLKNAGRIAAILACSSSALLRAAEFTLANDQVTLQCKTQGGRLLPGWLQDKKPAKG